MSASGKGGLDKVGTISATLNVQKFKIEQMHNLVSYRLGAISSFPSVAP